MDLARPDAIGKFPATQAMFLRRVKPVEGSASELRRQVREGKTQAIAGFVDHQEDEIIPNAP